MPSIATDCSVVSQDTWPISPHVLRGGVGALLDAFRCAVDVAQDKWWFAIQIRTLHELGMTDTHLRWMLGRNLLMHRRELSCDQLARSEYGCDREFHEAISYHFTEQSCFVLSESGLHFALQLCVTQPLDRTQPEEHRPISPIPCWNLHRKELWVSECLVKRFRVHSPNQVSVLEAFQEEGWPERIFDPLQPGRLAETIKSLNRHQKVPLIRFSGDGTGQGVLWEPISASPKESPIGG